MVLAVAGFSAAAKLPGLSVLYFENLSGRERHSHFSKALSEMLIADLSAARGLNLVERRQMDKIMEEIALGMSGIIDEESSPKVGRMLAADYMVMGSYLVEGRGIAVSAKVTKVETGTVIGGKKLEGTTREILDLTGRLSLAVLELLSTELPGIAGGGGRTEPAQEVAFDKVLDYGKALDLADKGDLAQAEEMLTSVVSSSPGFSYARHNLSALSKRIAEYDKKHQAHIDTLSRAPLTWQTMMQMVTNYSSGMQWTKLLAFCRTHRDAPPETPPGSMMSGAEMLDYYLIMAANSLKRRDLVIAEGERYLKHYPSSMFYNSVKMWLQLAASQAKDHETKSRKAHERARKKLEKLASAGADEAQKLRYETAMIFFDAGLFGAALEHFGKLHIKKAAAAAGVPVDALLYQVFTCYYQIFDKQNAAKVYKSLETFYPESQFLEAASTMMAVFAE
jgi:TolB-like protein/tetratricopeptide (TPR) repeat protein